MIKYLISWDLGATKCTAGLIEYDTISHQLMCRKKVTIKLSNSHSLLDLIKQLEIGLSVKMHEVELISIGAAGMYDGEVLTHTNPYPYPMPFAAIARENNWPSFTVIHDYASIVCATFTTYMQEKDNLNILNVGSKKPYGRRIALGLGTGLGLKDGILFANGDFWLGTNEAGHIGIPSPPCASVAYQKRHQELMNFLRLKYDRSAPINFERILTGSGTVNLYQFFYPNHSDNITPEKVGMAMRTNEAPEVVDTVAWYLGLFVGTMQLIFMPESGVWITGGVVINHMEIFASPDFYAGINALPAYLPERQKYPLGILCNLEHALIGSAYYAIHKIGFAQTIEQTIHDHYQSKQLFA